MDYEKKYKEAFKWIESLYPKFSHEQQMEAEAFFPELAESKDERIRKSIHIYLDWLDGRKDYAPRGEYSIRDMISWLEKQGNQKTIDSLTPQEAMDIAVAKCFNEQKSADKIEPKFHEGDILKHNKANIICKVISVNSGSYYVENIGTSGRIELFNAEQNFHLWTIQDAKDGDVLALNDEVFIYAHRKQMYSIAVAQCYVDSAGGFYFDGEFGYTEKGNSIHPATKEQRDLLFQKMTESGYKWDANKLELKKIDIQELVKQNPAWSEENNMMIEETLYFLREYQQSNRCKDENGMQNSVSCEKWLKSLKERINGKQ